MKGFVAVLWGMLLLLMPFAACHAQDSELFALKNRWEYITTQTPENKRADALGELAEDAKALAKTYPNNARVLVWQGIVLASQARAKGGVGALGLAKEARASLEQAIRLDPQGNVGSAYVTLGALYDRVPGWPLGFGDDDQAERMFEKALRIRPAGIDVNYYYAVFLQDEGRLAEARQHARRAVEGEARAGRETSDEALRQEARRLLREFE
ncbi:hypothetical protein [Pistricoccus aurantiacus]|uniref:hypothetical protein n=1 Tax=Pistricoccus aurantiacus TaxID=1883414 RepID=UPI0036453ADE